jgi:transposase InsO family protein
LDSRDAPAAAGREKRRFKRTTDSSRTHPVAPNEVARGFDASAPNKVCVTDVTCIATREGWLYLALIFDLFGAAWSAGPRATPTIASSRWTRFAAQCTHEVRMRG